MLYPTIDEGGSTIYGSNDFVQKLSAVLKPYAEEQAQPKGKEADEFNSKAKEWIKRFGHKKDKK